MAIGIKFEFHKTKGLKNKLEKSIIQSLEGSAEMRKEMRRVFQQANRRIQNIEKAGAFSPAVASLGKGDIEGYSKFSVKGFGNTGDDWKALKKEYAKAVSFLNQPTSTATGAREFEQQVKKQLGVSDDLWKGVRNEVIGGYNGVSDDLLRALPYTDFMQEIYERASDSASRQMEQDAVKLADALQESINKTAETVAEAIDDLFDAFEDGFNIEF